MVKAAWLVYKWRNYCTLAFTDCDIKVQYTLPLDDLYSGLRTHTRRLWDLSSFKLLVDCCQRCFYKDSNFMQTNSWQLFFKQCFCRQNHIFLRWPPLYADLPSFLQQRHTDICCSVWGAFVMILCLQTSVKICHLDICHKQIKRGKNTMM